MLDYFLSRIHNSAFLLGQLIKGEGNFDINHFLCVFMMYRCYSVELVFQIIVIVEISHLMVNRGTVGMSKCQKVNLI